MFIKPPKNATGSCINLDNVFTYRLMKNGAIGIEFSSSQGEYWAVWQFKTAAEALEGMSYVDELANNPRMLVSTVGQLNTEVRMTLDEAENNPYHVEDAAQKHQERIDLIAGRRSKKADDPSAPSPTSEGQTNFQAMSPQERVNLTAERQRQAKAREERETSDDSPSS